MRCDRVWSKARLATFAADAPGVGVVEDGVVACLGGRIAYAGPAADAPAFEARQTLDCEGRWITPGLIDPHTHLVFGGDRAREFELRLAGASYEEIARAGGGIVSTMKATRAASRAELVGSALPRLDALIAEGLTTIEIKSGYGLSLDDELKSLRAARALADVRQVSVTTTFLGAHALPPEYADARTTMWTHCANRCCRSWQAPGWWTPWTPSANGSASPMPRPGACSPLRAVSACRSSCMPNSCRTSRGPNWWRAMAACRPTTSNT